MVWPKSNLNDGADKEMNIIDEIKKVAESGILPDGDHINIPTQLWLEDLINFETDIIQKTIVESNVKKGSTK